MAITSRPRTRYPFNGTSTTSRMKCERWSKASGLSLHTSCPRSGAKNRQRRGDAAAARSWWSLGRVLINRDCSAIARCRKRRVRIAPEAQAIFFRRRHQPRRPPLAKMRPGRPAPTMGPGTLCGGTGVRAASAACKRGPGGFGDGASNKPLAHCRAGPSPRRSTAISLGQSKIV